MHRTVAAALLAALTLGLAGCGGGEQTETVSRAQLVSRLDAACVAGQRASREETQGGSGSQDAFLQGLRANMTTILDDVGSLEASGAARAPFSAYKDSVRTRLDEVERVAAAQGADRQRAIRAAQPVMSAATDRAHAAIVRLGARHDCI
jgi:hypothetical protein